MITDTILRDAHQSLAATRMRFDEMEPVLSQLDEIGYYSLEAWAGPRSTAASDISARTRGIGSEI